MTTKLTPSQATVLRRMFAGDTLTRTSFWCFASDQRRLAWDMMRRIEREGLVETADEPGTMRTYRLSHAGMLSLAAYDAGGPRATR